MKKTTLTKIADRLLRKTPPQSEIRNSQTNTSTSSSHLTIVSASSSPRDLRKSKSYQEIPPASETKSSKETEQHANPKTESATSISRSLIKTQSHYEVPPQFTTKNSKETEQHVNPEIESTTSTSRNLRKAQSHYEMPKPETKNSKKTAQSPNPKTKIAETSSSPKSRLPRKAKTFYDMKTAKVEAAKEAEEKIELRVLSAICNGEGAEEILKNLPTKEEISKIATLGKSTTSKTMHYQELKEIIESHKTPETNFQKNYTAPNPIKN